jgi:hypothetical protein
MEALGGRLVVVMNLGRRIGLLIHSLLVELTPQCAPFQYEGPQNILCETPAKNPYAIGVLQTLTKRFGKGCL